MHIAVIIASVGRPAILARTVDRLADQTRPADRVIVSVTKHEDAAGIAGTRCPAEVLISSIGSCAQRNAGLDRVKESADVVVFFDDDFVPAHDYLEQVEALIGADSAVAGLTGDLVADGIHGGPIDFDEAAHRLDVLNQRPTGHLRQRMALYGCNMAVSLRHVGDRRFDENLPLYGWQEDIDFTYPLSRHAQLLSGPQLTGIHLGARGGRQAGKRLGYSQVANIVYLTRKGTMQPGLGRRLMWHNVMANALRSVWPEAGIDRRGRLLGNMLAFGDVLRGRVDPRRITQF